MDDKVRTLLVLYEDVEAADLVDECPELFFLFFPLLGYEI